MQAPNVESDLSGRLTVLERIADGETSAVEECIRTYSGLVWKIARKHSRNNEDAEDVVQEIFTSLWMNAERFDRTKSPEIAFVCLIAQRKAIDVFRKQRHHLSEIELSEAEISPNPKDSDYKNVLLGLDLKTIRQALKKLPSAENEMIKLSVYGGSSHSEIAESLNLPLGTVKSKIRRGISKIKTIVGEPVLTDLRKAYYS